MSKANENVAKKEIKKHTGAKKAEPAKKVEAKKEVKQEKKAEEKKPVEKKEVKGKKTKEEIETELESLNVLKYPLITEKAVNMIEAENKLVFVVDNRATKGTVRKAVESLYNVKVRKVNMLKDMKGKKRAIVRLMKEFKAGNVATKLGVI